MNKCYIILYKDGCIQVFPNKQDMSAHQNGARQFVCKDDCPMIEIPEWVGSGYKLTRSIKEVTN